MKTSQGAGRRRGLYYSPLFRFLLLDAFSAAAAAAATDELGERGILASMHRTVNAGVMIDEPVRCKGGGAQRQKRQSDRATPSASCGSV